MLKGFRDFIVRGNVVDLAVGFVMGVAFSTLVTQFTVSFLDPLIRVLFGGRGAAGTWTIRGEVFDWAAFLNAVIAFLLTAATLYFLVVLPMNKLAERRRRGEQPAAEEQGEEVRLLTEIRDSLAVRR
ncbi:MAG: large conductance mechanosensitive channel protein MscL [Micromonosporaceae bacterium]|nr:large conductance mechanosensitive channel protein MscL [Micromonosporaceae bacterium]